MGIALADAAAEYGAEVTLVLGPVERIPGNASVRIINVVSAGDMASECVSAFTSSDIAILSAAVADFTPAEKYDRKIKRTGDEVLLRLKPTGDIAAALGRMKKYSQLLVGFALETHNEMSNAEGKL
jgi:phosphopantothenoylcysteine decarboxylase/phosphopantothenate--cysteine ligase